MNYIRKDFESWDEMAVCMLSPFLLLIGLIDVFLDCHFIIVKIIFLLLILGLGAIILVTVLSYYPKK